MKKSKLLATVLLFAMFSSLLTVVNFNSPASSSPVTPVAPVVTPEALGDPMGDSGILIEDVTALTIVADGVLADWAATPFDRFGGVYTYVGYDATNVYVAVTWMDSSNDGVLSEWNKTGATKDNVTHAVWADYDGADDMVAVGFSNGTYTDMWIWAESLRGDANYAYEADGAGKADAGNLPFLRNIDVSEEALGWLQPEYDNTTTSIVNQGTLANGTAYIGWFDNTPTGSQTDVDIAYTWNASGDDMYVVEFIRPLDTGSEVDDILLDFTTLAGMSFFVGSANKQDSKDMDVSVVGLKLTDVNVPMEFSWDVVDDTVNSAMLLTGVIWDDFDHVEINIHLSGWANTYGPGFWWDYSNGINPATGEWSALFYYDEDDMPLGDQTINVSIHTSYEVDYVTYQNVSIVDNTAPQVVGLVDLNERYPNGVPNGTEYVPITVGASDDYNYWVGGLAGYSDTDLLTVRLYCWADDDVALMTPMVQFSSGGATFSANITLPALAAGETHNYTYFVQVFDPENNKVTSVYYWFIHGDIISSAPGFGILVGLFGLAGAAFIIYKKRK